MNNSPTIRQLWLMIVLSLPIFLFAQSANSHVYKIYAGDEAEICKDCPKALKRAHFVLQMDDSDQLLLEMVNLTWLPEVVRKKKDQISFTLSKEDVSCGEWIDLERLALDRNSLRSQLYEQFDTYQWLSQEMEFDKILLKGLRSWQRTMEERPSEMSDSYFRELVGGQLPADMKGKYLSYLKVSTEELERRIAATQSQAGLDDKQKNSRISKLKESFTSQKKGYKQQYKKYRKQRRRFKKFLKGKTTFNMASQRFVWRLTFPMKQSTLADRFEMEIVRKGQSCASVLFDDWQVELENNQLTAVDQVVCVPIDRSLTFFSRPKRRRRKRRRLYRPTTKFRKRKSFTLEFEKGKSDYTLEDLAPIEEFLTDSSYTILKAQIEAYASVEGDSAINMELQQNRAEILENLLVTINEDSIETDVYTAENWKLFARQLKQIHEADGQSRGQTMPQVPDLRGQSPQKVKAFLEDDENERLFEPLLAKQRRAILKLIVSYRLTEDKKAAIFQEDMKKMDKLINHPKASNQQKAQAYQRILDMRRYVRNAVRKGELTEDSEKHQQIFRYRSTRLDIMEFYDFKSDLERGQQLVHQSMEEILRRAYQATNKVLRGMTQKHTDKQRKEALNDAMQVQFFTYKLILKDTLDVSFFCEFRYPNSKIFWTLKMNRIDFGTRVGKDQVDRSACPFRVMTKKEESRISSQNSMFYNLIKKLALDPKGPQMNPFYPFDLLRFLSMNVDYWEVEKGKYYDPEIDVLEMIKWMNKLDQVGKKVCSKAVNQLRLDLHTKAIYHYAQLNNRTAQGRLQAQALNSAEEIKDYYVGAPTDKQARLETVEYLLARQPLLYNKSVWSWSRELLEPWADRDASYDATAMSVYYGLEVILSDRPAQVLATAREKLNQSDWCSLYNELKPILKAEGIPQYQTWCRECK